LEDAWKLDPLGRMPEELEAMPECPPGFEYLWAWFLRLNSTRGGMGGGISETELKSFFENRGIKPEPFEIRVLERLDAVALSELADKPHKENEDKDE
jgi:hypothetical protein